jgi:hypothetical protein
MGAVDASQQPLVPLVGRAGPLEDVAPAGRAGMPAPRPPRPARAAGPAHMRQRRRAARAQATAAHLALTPCAARHARRRTLQVRDGWVTTATAVQPVVSSTRRCVVL